VEAASPALPDVCAFSQHRYPVDGQRQATHKPGVVEIDALPGILTSVDISVPGTDGKQAWRLEDDVPRAVVGFPYPAG